MKILKGIIFFFLPMITFYIIGGYITLDFNIIEYQQSTRAALIIYGIILGICLLAVASTEDWLE